MSTSATPEPAPGTMSENAPELSEGQRLINVFVAPSKTFTDLKARGNWSWIVPWLVVVVMGYASIALITQKVSFRQMTENILRTNSKMQDRMTQMPAEQRERMLEGITTSTKAFTFGLPVLLLVIYLLIAGVLMATLNVGMGAEIPFPTVLSVVAYAQLPMITRSLLAIVALYAGADPEGFNPENPIASNLGYFIDVSSHPAWHALGAAIDIFAIWVIVLTGIGLACLTKVKKPAAIGVVFAWYMLYILVLKVAPAALFS